MNAELSTNTESIIREGWNVLVSQLGIQKASQFVIQIERGRGDTVTEIAKYWGDAEIGDIHNRVVQWKKKESPVRATCL